MLILTFRLILFHFSLEQYKHLILLSICLLVISSIFYVLHFQVKHWPLSTGHSHLSTSSPLSGSLSNSVLRSQFLPLRFRFFFYFFVIFFFFSNFFLFSYFFPLMFCFFF